MKNTIKIDGRIYRCRDNSIEPLHFYRDGTRVLNYPHSLVIKCRNGINLVVLDKELKGGGAVQREYDLIEVKPELTDKEKLIEHFKVSREPKLVMCDNGSLTIATSAENGEWENDEQFLSWNRLERLATREEALSLVLESEGE